CIFVLCRIPAPVSACSLPALHHNKQLKSLKDELTIMSRRVPDKLFTTNDPPTPSQATLLRQEIDQITSTISFLGTEVPPLAMGGRLRTLNTLFHPVCRLPDDILIEIFEFCVASAYSPWGKPPPSLDTRTAPWTQAQVCRRWKVVSLSTPHLWNAIEYFPTRITADGEPSRKTLSLLELRLQRAQNQSLSISLIGVDWLGKIPSTLLSTSPYWRDLTICLFGMGHFGFMSPCRGSLHNLSTLHLDIRKPSTLWGDCHLLTVFETTPNLRRLTLSGKCDNLLFLRAQLPWSQITHFTTTDIRTTFGGNHPTNFYFQILPLLKNVQVCSLEVSVQHAETQTPLTLPYLHSLTFTTASLPQTATIPSNYLDLPALRSLRFSKFSQVIPDCLICHSGGLEELIMDDFDIDSNDLVRILVSPPMQSVHTVNLKNAREILSRDSEEVLRLSGIETTESEERQLGALSKIKDPASSHFHLNLRYVILYRSKREWQWTESSTGKGEWDVVQVNMS
ncbi:hypothetical protein L218DRAFT_1019686, partial [Marasmius fiardii PR-910]